MAGDRVADIDHVDVIARDEARRSSRRGRDAVGLGVGPSAGRIAGGDRGDGTSSRSFAGAITAPTAIFEAASRPMHSGRAILSGRR